MNYNEDNPITALFSHNHLMFIELSFKFYWVSSVFFPDGSACELGNSDQQ